MSRNLNRLFSLILIGFGFAILISWLNPLFETSWNRSRSASTDFEIKNSEGLKTTLVEQKKKGAITKLGYFRSLIKKSSAETANSPESRALNIPYSFPVKPGSDEWKKKVLTVPPWELCQIPNEVLTNLTTLALVRTCLAYPMRGDIALFDNPTNGLSSVLEKFNGLKELYTRYDAVQPLLDAYLEFKPKHVEVPYEVAQRLNQEGFLAGYIDLTYSTAIVDSIIPRMTFEQKSQVISHTVEMLVELRELIGPSAADILLGGPTARLFMEHDVLLYTRDGNVLDKAFFTRNDLDSYEKIVPEKLDHFLDLITNVFSKR